MFKQIIHSSLVLGTLTSFPSVYFIPFPSVEELLGRPSGRPFTISVEGNVGAGKSTLLDYFDQVRLDKLIKDNTGKLNLFYFISQVLL